MGSFELSGDNFIVSLNRLLDACKDSQQVYREAEQDVNDPELKTIFATYASQRDTFLESLRGIIIQMGGASHPAGTLGGIVQRGWMNVKAILTGGDVREILAECGRREGEVLRVYEEVLDGALPDYARHEVLRQCELIRAAHDNIMMLHASTDS